MTARKRATIYFDPDTHRALRLKAAATDRTISDLVNEVLRQRLAKDAEDLTTIAERANEPSIPFEEVVAELKRRGKL